MRERGIKGDKNSGNKLHFARSTKQINQRRKHAEKPTEAAHRVNHVSSGEIPFVQKAADLEFP